MKVIGLDAIKNGLSYVRRNPAFLVRAALHATRLEIGVPLDALRWLLGRLPQGKSKAPDIRISASPPALRVEMDLDLMGQPLGISTLLYIEKVGIEAERLLIELRVKHLKIKAPPQSPINQMLAAVDLNRPGSLVGFVPMKIPALVEARDDLFVFDLLQIPKLAGNAGLRRALSALSEVLAIRQVQTEDELLVIGLRAQPMKLPAALGRLRRP